jgi:hypothetical protein
MTFQRSNYPFCLTSAKADSHVQRNVPHLPNGLALLEYTLKALEDLKDQRIRLVFSFLFSFYYTATIFLNPV